MKAHVHDNDNADQPAASATRIAQKENYLIGRGLAGWHAKGIDASGNSFSSSGGNLEDYTYWTGQACQGYKSRAVEGCHIYDAQHLEGTEAESAFVHFIYSGPMVSAKLQGDSIDKFWHDEDKIKALDFVSPAQYIALLKARVPGVKTGRIYNGEIIWEAAK